jgi:UDP-2,3-diacylglucosamine pyrophosphatase LpxH
VADRYLIISDLHLCDVEEHPDGWKFFKSGRYLVDAHVSALVDRFLRAARPGDRTTLLLNGDVFDFDLVTALPDGPAPWKISWVERRCGLAPTAEKSAWKLRHVLDHHPEFVATLARVIAGGGRVVYVLGNHDREMHFAAARSELTAAIAGRLAAGGATWNGEGLTVEPWFFHVPGLLYAEHGNQYDPFTAYRDVLCPTVDVAGEERLALPMGNLSNRYLLGRIGRFNPFDGDYIRSAASYALHWLRYYAFSKRSLVANWFLGALLVFATLVRTRGLSPRPGPAPGGESSRAPGDLDPAQIEDLRTLQCRPVAERTFRMARELWLDRVTLWLAFAAGVVALVAAPTPLWLDAAVSLVGVPLLSATYERIVARDSIFDVRRLMVERADEIARRLGVGLVTFGHDHVPKVARLSTGATFVDSGTWAPITTADAARDLVPGHRTYVVVVAGDGEVETQVDVWPVAHEVLQETTGAVEIGQSARTCA